MELLGVPQTDLCRGHPAVHRIVEAFLLTDTSRAPIDPRLWRVSAPMRRFLVTSTVFGVLTAAATIGSAVVFAAIVARVITDPAARQLDVLTVPIVVLVTLWTVRTMTQWLQGRLAQRGASAVIADLADQVLTTATALAPRELARRRDDAAVVVTRGLDGLRVYFTTYLPALFIAAILTPATAVVIAFYDRASALIVLITLPLIPIFMVLIGLATADRSKAALVTMSTLQSRMLDLVAGLPTLRALGRTDGAATRVAELGAAHRRSTMATMRIAFLSAFALELLATLGVALVAVSIGMRLVYGEVTLTAGLTALLLAPEVFWPLRRVGAAFHSAQDGKTAVTAAFEFLDGAPAPPSGTHAMPERPVTISIESPPVEVRPGQVTVLTGPNGSGKTTLLQAVLGLNSPLSGAITVNGVDVAELDLHQWWSNVAWLAHRPVLIPGTVLENLQLFGPLPDVTAACRAACFDSVLRELPDGLNTTIGRGGVGLSLGQRQRLGLARVLGSTAPVLLFDEPTAHLDGPTETRILQEITQRARQGATVLVVGHRKPVLAVGDVIVHLEPCLAPAMEGGAVGAPA